mgnify:CR=1 FL=1
MLEAFKPEEEPDDAYSIIGFTDPRWRGKLGWAPTNGSFQAFVTALRVQHGDARAKEFLTGLKANDPVIRDGNVQIVADVNDGKIPVGLVNHYYLYPMLEERGDGFDARNHFFTNGDIGGMVTYHLPQPMSIGKIHPAREQLSTTLAVGKIVTDAPGHFAIVDNPGI